MDIHKHEPAVDQEHYDKDTAMAKELWLYQKEICQNCRGKGYSTNFHGIEGSSDLDGASWEEPKKVHVVYCSCERGKGLEKMVQQQQAEAQGIMVQRIYKQMIKRTVAGFVKSMSVQKMLNGYWRTLQTTNRPITKYR